MFFIGINKSKKKILAGFTTNKIVECKIEKKKCKCMNTDFCVHKKYTYFRYIHEMDKEYKNTADSCVLKEDVKIETKLDILRLLLDGYTFGFEYNRISVMNYIKNKLG